MSLVDTILSRVGRPAGRALDPTIRDLVHQVLKEHGYASPAEVQALRDEVRDMRSRVDGMVRRVDELTTLTQEARAQAEADRAAARAAIEAAKAAPAPAAAAPEAEAEGCKVAGCSGAVRSKGFCSPHYQQWRRGTLKGFVGLDGQVTVGDQSFKVKVALAGAAAELRDGKLVVDGKPA